MKPSPYECMSLRVEYHKWFQKSLEKYSMKWFFSRDERNHLSYKTRKVEETVISRMDTFKKCIFLDTIPNLKGSRGLKTVTYKMTFSPFYHCKLHLIKLGWL